MTRRRPFFRTRRTMKAGIRATLALALLALVGFSGCTGAYKQRVNQQLWERELRLQEDCIYRLKWQLEDTQRALDEANARTGTLRKETDIYRGGSGGPELAPPRPSAPPGGRGGEGPALPPAPNVPDIQPGQEF